MDDVLAGQGKAGSCLCLPEMQAWEPVSCFIQLVPADFMYLSVHSASATVVLVGWVDYCIGFDLCYICISDSEWHAHLILVFIIT